MPRFHDLGSIYREDGAREFANTRLCDRGEEEGGEGFLKGGWTVSLTIIAS